INHTFVAGLSEESRHWRLHRLHPLLELALLDLCFARRCLGLKDVFLRRGFKILRHRFLEALFVLPNHAGHTIELFHAPVVGASDSAGEERLMCVEDVLELVHWVSPESLTRRLPLWR